ncbi:MAG: 3-phosphoshikimate 1-carboxyvinyltransferase [Candidatus Eremiobacteraeota bacterium]|nr:3-phosphoshikimate 1-carboxyvinyltransferase [Candidatus Eremiobacteraeota bacterium]
MRVPGDKSISHRAFMLAALAEGTSVISGANEGADVRATRDAVAALGARVEPIAVGFSVTGSAWHDPHGPLDARNSGTTARLLMGACAGHGVHARFDGDESLRRRPMERIARPLRTLGAEIVTTSGRLPVSVRGVRSPDGREFELEVPSAQIKSAILLAMLAARGVAVVGGDQRSRDHTERMLRHFGRDVSFDGRTVVLRPGTMQARDLRVPGDLSAAAFFFVAAAITPGSDLLVRDVGVNPTRSGILDALELMGADLSIARRREVDGEPVADVRVRYRPLKAIEIGGDLVVRAIDEIPVLCVAAAHAQGTTTIRDAAELRVKESDRIATMAAVLRGCCIGAQETSDGLTIVGGAARIPDKTLTSRGDHRIAMAIAALAAPTGGHTVDDAACIAISFPGFAELWAAAQARDAGTTKVSGEAAG